MHGRDPCSLTLQKENELMMFKNRLSRKIFWPKKEEVGGGWKNCMRSFKICTAHHCSLVYQIKEDKVNRARGTNRREEIHT